MITQETHSNAYPNIKIGKELLKGTTVILVMSALALREMYGYEILKEIESRSSGVFALNEGTLYPILHALEAESRVESRWEGEAGGRRRKYYRLTREGRAALKDKKREWNHFRATVEQVLAGGPV